MSSAASHRPAPARPARRGERGTYDIESLLEVAVGVFIERGYDGSSMEDLAKGVDMVLKQVDETLAKHGASPITSIGQPFDPNTSEKYRPLAPDEFKQTLLEFAPRRKESPMAQLADLYLWPICMGGYNKANRPYKRLFDDGKLIECIITPDLHEERATKYSCFDNIK